MLQLKEFNHSTSIKVSFDYRVKSGSLYFEYLLEGELDKVNLTPLSAPQRFQRKDELWLDTCFECFFQIDKDSYEEFNLSPFGHWQCYRFSAYRQNRSLGPGKFDDLCSSFSEKRFDISGVFSSPAIKRKEGLRFNPVVIIKKSNKLLYYASNHSVETPDFHQKDLWPFISNN